MYLETSKDILNIALAISVFGLAFILGWILVYFLLIIRRLANLISSIDDRLKALDNLFHTVKDKLEHSASTFSVMALGIKELVTYFIEKKLNKKSGIGKK